MRLFLYYRLIVCFFLFLFMTTLRANPEAVEKKLSFKNEFIQIIVNNTTPDMGRFAIETTLGDPKNPFDDDAPLIFGRPLPWTSYTTIYIDEKAYIFGGKNPKLFKRKGKTVHFGKVISQKYSNQEIVTVCQFGDVIVTQTLRFFRSSGTRVNDAAQIAYTIDNQGEKEARIGLRMMLDTKLGSNDGAPFRLGNLSITSEKLFHKEEVYDYWQAFDSFSIPKVVSQGTLKDSRLTPPSKLYLANWGTLVDSPWVIDYEENRSFLRDGEVEQDTALALYWEPTLVLPATTRYIATAYGLGGVNLSPGELSLGLSAPKALYVNGKNDALVMGYILNSGGYDSQNTVATFEFPDGVSLLNGKSRIELGVLKVGETYQIPLKIKTSTGIKPFHGKISFSVESSTLDNNKISQSFSIITPPQFTASLKAEPVPSQSIYIPVELTVTNPSKFPIYSVQGSVARSESYEVPPFEQLIKTVSILPPRSSKSLIWLVQPSQSGQPVPIDLHYQSNTQEKNLISTVYQFPNRSVNQFIFSKASLQPDHYFYVDIDLDQDNEALEDVSIQYSPEHFRFIRFSPSSWLRKSKVQTQLILQPGFVTLNDIVDRIDRSIGKFHFKAIQAGASSFTFIHNNEVKLITPIQVKAQSN